MLAFINISSGLTLTGIKNISLPSRNPKRSFYTPDASIPGETIKTTFRITDYNDPFAGEIVPNTFNASVGKKYTLLVDAEVDGVGCMSTIMIPGLVNTPQLLRKGQKHELTFIASSPGSYPITCAMGVPFGTIKVT
jgi:hypothetical protein